MKRFRLWLSWIFGGLGYQRLDMAWQRIEALEKLTGEQNQILMALTGEVNDLRNNLPAVLTAPAPPQIRRVGWKDFKPAATLATRAQGALRQ